MNAVHLAQSEPSRVEVSDVVRIRDLIETDPYVRVVLAAAADPVGVTHTLLRIGAQAVQLAGPNLDAQVVEHAFDDLVRSFKSLLGTSFDADSRSSVIAKIVDALDPDKPDSPGGRGTRQILDALREVLMAVTEGRARAQVTELTAIKGLSYEDVVEAGLGRLASLHGDILERVSKAYGQVGTKKGDFKITINPDDTCGQDAGPIAECKDGPVSMPRVMTELSNAILNHAAQAGIAVFSRAEHAPSEVRQFPFWWSGNRAVVIYDKQAPDDRALQLAYEWARWVCRRDLTTDGAAVNAGHVETLFTRGRQALAKRQQWRSCLTQARNKIDEGQRHADDMADEIDDVLAQLRDELTKGGHRELPRHDTGV